MRTSELLNVLSILKKMSPEVIALRGDQVVAEYKGTAIAIKCRHSVKNAVIPFELIYRLVKKLPEAKLTVKEDNEDLLIRFDSAQYIINGTESTEFVIEDDDYHTQFDIELTQLLGKLASARKFAKKSSHSIFDWIQLQHQNGKLSINSSCKTAYYHGELEIECDRPFDVLITKEVISLLEKLKNDESITVRIGDRFIQVISSKYKIISRISNEKMISISNDGEIKLETNAKRLKKAIQRVTTKKEPFVWLEAFHDSQGVKVSGISGEEILQATVHQSATAYLSGELVEKALSRYNSKQSVAIATDKDKTTFRSSSRASEWVAIVPGKTSSALPYTIDNNRLIVTETIADWMVAHSLPSHFQQPHERRSLSQYLEQKQFAKGKTPKEMSQINGKSMTFNRRIKGAIAFLESNPDAMQLLKDGSLTFRQVYEVATDESRMAIVQQAV